MHDRRSRSKAALTFAAPVLPIFDNAFLVLRRRYGSIEQIPRYLSIVSIGLFLREVVSSSWRLPRLKGAPLRDEHESSPISRVQNLPNLLLPLGIALRALRTFGEHAHWYVEASQVLHNARVPGCLLRKTEKGDRRKDMVIGESTPVLQDCNPILATGFQGSWVKTAMVPGTRE